MNYGVATADGGMLVNKGETMNETLTDAQLAEIEARANAATPGCQAHSDGTCDGTFASCVLMATPIPMVDRLVVDVFTLIAALRASRERLRSLANTWDLEAEAYPAEGDYARVAVHLCAKELRAALGEEAPHA